MYVEHGQPVGGFLEAVLCNDLLGAFDRADSDHQACLMELVRHIRKNMPLGCWGSKVKMAEWMSHRGLERLDTDKGARYAVSI